MSFDPHSRQFRPRRPFTALEIEQMEESQLLDEYLFCADEEPTNHPGGQPFDEALEQIALEGRCVCPLCGAIVTSDGSVLS